MREKSQLNLKSLTYASAGRCSRARHLGRLATHGKLCLRVAGRLHVRELIGALLGEVVKATGDHHLRLAGKDRVTGDLERLKCGCAVGRALVRDRFQIRRSHTRHRRES